MPWPKRIVVVLLFALLQAGCRSVQPVSYTIPSSDDLSVEIWASKDCIRSGEPVHLRATVTNDGAKPFAVDLQDRPVLDLLVGEGSTILQRWSDGKPLTPDVTGLALQPGQSKTIEMDWIPTASVYGPAYAIARYIRRFTWGDDPLVLPITIEVQACRGPLP